MSLTDFAPDAHRLAMELECLLLECADTRAVSKWWDSANEALDQHRALFAVIEAEATKPKSAAECAAGPCDCDPHIETCDMCAPYLRATKAKPHTTELRNPPGAVFSCGEATKPCPKCSTCESLDAQLKAENRENTTGRPNASSLRPM